MNCRDLISLALKKHKIVSPGENPTDGESTDGLSVLQTIVDEIYVGWTDVDVSADYTAKPDERVHVTGSVTVTLPTEEENGDPLRTGAKVMVIASATTLSVWRDGEWITASGLTLDSTVPFEDQLTNVAADALAYRFGLTFHDPSAVQMRAGERAMAILSLATRRVAPFTYY